MNALEKGSKYIEDLVERILCQIDHDVLSPTYGCAHVSYWRDKTSDNADTRMQEVCFTLAMLYKYDLASNKYRNDVNVLTTISALLQYWASTQYSDGSFDEWYKGERAYAACAFSIHAVSRTVYLLRDDLGEELLKKIMNSIDLGCKWLSQRKDLFKTNHEAVGIAALTFGAKVLEDEKYLRVAQEKVDFLLSTQQKEGWFKEIGQLDIGYTFLTVEYLLMANELIQSERLFKLAAKAFDFACEWLRPNFSHNGDHSICHNTYISSIAIIKLCGKNSYASFLYQHILLDDLEHKKIINTGDDLRLMRWSFLSVLAELYAREVKTIADIQKPSLFQITHISNEYYISSAGLLKRTVNGLPVVIGIFCGGSVEMISHNGSVLNNCGYAIIDETNNKYSSLTYNKNLNYTLSDDHSQLKISVPIVAIKKFTPNFYQRFILQLISQMAWSSKAFRILIDKYRKHKGSALNQSSANLSGDSNMLLVRVVGSSGKDLIIKDEIRINKSLNSKKIFHLFKDENNKEQLVPINKHTCNITNKIEIEKVYQAQGCWEEMSPNQINEKLCVE